MLDEILMRHQTRRSVKEKLKQVLVNDSIQKGYIYALSAPIGRNFDPEFKPELAPEQMLALVYFAENT